MTVPFDQKALHVDLATGGHHVEEIAPDSGIIGPVDFGWREYRRHDGDVFTFGEGKLASSAIPGSRRLVFCAHSDQWEGFYISSMGGAAHTFQHVGVNYVSLTSAAPEPSVLLLNNDGETPSVRIEPLPDYADLWEGYEKDDEKLIGIYAIQQALLDRHGDEYDPRRVRIFCVGPAAEHTVEGVIGSNTVKKGAMLPVVDWAGRGGLGSRLFRKHNIVAVMFGGDWMDPHAPKTKELNPYFEEHFGDKMVKVDMAMTKKYHFDPKLNTGGTFGSNYTNLKDKIMTFNYRSTKRTKSERLRQHKLFIVEHYLKQFNEETIRPKNFDHCGEPCSVACKKLNGKYKKDYEPYHALGPQCGVFDQRAAELLNDYADAMGFDAIQIGGMLAWIMECVATDLMDPTVFGFPPKDELRFAHFTDDPEEFDIVRDSMRNARYAMAVIDAILHDDRAALFSEGLRVAAEQLGGACFERAVYLANGEKGCMVPNQYWVPGMGSPMPIMGKYYVYYGSDFMPPQDLGRKNVERMVHELINDNCGQCRFHRGWSESLLPVIMNDRFGLDVDFKAHHFELARQIHEYQGDRGVPWQTRRMAEMLEGYLTYVAKPPTSTEEQANWPQIDPDDPVKSAQAFWRAIKEGIDRTFRLGEDAIPRALTPKQQQERYAAGE